MKEKLTRWFPESLPPARVGWYEVRGCCFIGKLRLWDGYGWRWDGSNGNSMTKTTKQAAFGGSDKWRGLATKPKGFK